MQLLGDRYIIGSKKVFFQNDNTLLICEDSFKMLKKIKPQSIDMIFADPPYFLSNDGITCKGGKMVSVNKADWDKHLSVKDKHNFNRKWIRLCYPILKDTGTIWISGTMHNIYSIGLALEEEGFKILNNITWQKTNPPPNLSCRYFTHSTETVLWAKKDIKKAKHYFNYKLMKSLNNDKQMKDVWQGSLVKKTEKKEGRHPTQKPIYLLDRIINASTEEGDIILDPFCGSGTTGVAAIQNKRFFIGIDNCVDYLEISKRRMVKDEK